jgi:hypothetical protein
MATPEGSKQSLLRKTFVDPFRLSMSRRKSSIPIIPTVTPPPSIQDPLDALPPLQYGSLDTSKKTIRLLEIVLAPEYEPVQATMSVCDLDEKPAYIALSYTWDKGGQRKNIDIQGTRFTVGEGLWNFLVQYRKKEFLRQCSEKDPVKPMPLWIDAIVIDQSNMAERNHQVPLMRDIYTGAESVIVWLGLATGSEELAFLLARHPSLLRIEEFHLALADVLNKPYWSRVWVVQEFVLAQRVDIWCGDLCVDAAVVESIWRNGLASTPIVSATRQIYTSCGHLLFKYRRDFKHSKQYKRDVMGRRNSRTLKATFRLRDLLQAFASSQSTVEHDRVYGFLGVASKGRGEKILPDYSKSVVELLVDVLRNQCNSDHKGGDKDDYKFLAFLMRALNVSCEKLAQHVLQLCPEVQPHIYVLTAAPCMTASVSFISTITEVGEFVDYDEAFLGKTWTAGWTRSNMHPRSFTNQDILDLGDIVTKRETDILLSFADPHVPYGNPGPSQKVRQMVIEDSTDLIITGLIKASAETSGQYVGNADASDGNNNRVMRDILKRSMFNDAAALYMNARSNRLSRRDTDQRHARYTSFVGTNGITGLACGGGAGSYEVRPGDRICTFSGVTDSNNGFILRLSPGGKWLISGFAIILLPELRTPAVARNDAGKTPISDISRQQSFQNETILCFHCHLSDLLELQRCQLLSQIQMSRLLEQTLQAGKMHCCAEGNGEHDVLEFEL